MLGPPLPTVIWIEFGMGYMALWMGCKGYGWGGTYKWRWLWQISMGSGGYGMVFEVRFLRTYRSCVLLIVCVIDHA